MQLKSLVWTSKNASHIARHEITPSEIEEVMFGGTPLIRKGRENVYYSYGQTGSGRYLFVVFVLWNSGQGFVVTARQMTEAERKLYLKNR